MAVRMTLPSLALPRAARRVSAQRASFAGNRVALKASAPVSVRASSRPALSVSATLDVDTEALKAKATAAAESALEAAKAQPVVAAYGAGLLVGLYFVEKLIHLPVLDLVIAFPLELLGVFTAGVLALRYTKEGVDVNDDVAMVKANLIETLPGLK